MKCNNFTCYCSFELADLNRGVAYSIPGKDYTLAVECSRSLSHFRITYIIFNVSCTLFVSLSMSSMSSMSTCIKKQLIIPLTRCAHFTSPLISNTTTCRAQFPVNIFPTNTTACRWTGNSSGRVFTTSGSGFGGKTINNFYRFRFGLLGQLTSQ